MNTIGASFTAGARTSDQFGTSLAKQGDAVASARRGATEVVSAYVQSGPALEALGTAISVVSLATGSGLARVAAATKLAITTSAEEMRTGMLDSTAHVKTLEEKLADLPTPIVAAVDAFAAFEAVKTTWDAFNAALEDTEVRLKRLAAIGKTAQELGVGTDFLTQLTAQAQQLGVETSSLTGMIERAREASKIRLGEGGSSNQSSFQARADQHVEAGNLKAEDLAPYNAAQTQEAQIRAVLDLLDKLKEEQRFLAANDLGKTFFGADFEAKSRQGIDLAGAMRNALDGVKTPGSALAPTPEEIARAQEFLKREEAIAATIRDAIAPAVRDFNTLSDYGKRTWIEWQERVAAWVKWLGEGYLKIRAIVIEVKKAAQDWGLIGQDEPSSGESKEGGPLVLRVRNKRKEDRSNPLGGPKPRPSSGGGSSPDSVADLIRSLEKARDVAEAELRTFGLSNIEKAKALELTKAEAAARSDVEKGVRASAALTEEETRKIIAAAEATARAKARVEDLEKAQQQAAETARYFGQTLNDALASALIDGRSLVDVLGDVVKMLERAILQAALLGTGPLAGLLGTAPSAADGAGASGGLLGLVTSAFTAGGSAAVGASTVAADTTALASVPIAFAANGARVRGADPIVVGEAGRELFIPDQDGRVVPIGRGGGMNVTGPSSLSISVDVSGARGNQEIMGMVQAGVASGMRSLDTNLNRTIGSRMRDWKMRYG